VNADPSVRPRPIFGGLWLTSPAGALSLGIAAAVSMVVAVPFLFVDGFDIWLGLIPFGLVGAAIARRQPGNPIGPVMLLLTAAIVASGDAGQYAVEHYRRGHGSLPLAPLAAFLAPGIWLWLVVFLPLPLALFPDGRLGQRWRRVLWAYLAFCVCLVGANVWENGTGVLARHLRIDSSGQLASNDTSGLSVGSVVIILWYLAFVLLWVARLLLSYRRATGDYRQQLKWLLSGGAVGITGLLLAVSTSNASTLGLVLGGVGFITALVALPVSLGVAILKYRLYDIDRLISRTISYGLLTALLAGVFVAIVVLATNVLPFSSPVGVAASTLTAAALFNPLRVHIQRLVDRRFNRARYDAEAVIASLALRLREAADLDTVRGELLQAVNGAVQPTCASLWVAPPTTHAPAHV
jgi:hypothetical protein